MADADAADPQSGYLLAPGRLAALVALLRWPMERAPPKVVWPKGASIARCALSVSEFRALYGAIGAAHLWHTRLQLSDEALAAWLTATDVAVDILMLGRRPVGLVELDFRQEGLCQLAHLGVLPGFRGRGLGQSLLAHALAKASRPGVHTLWLSTSSFDAPSALPFYLKAGFRFDRYAVEIFEDPRLNKLLPADSCPRWPLAPLTTP